MIITINSNLTLYNIQQFVFLMQIRWIICEVRSEHIVFVRKIHMLYMTFMNFMKYRMSKHY